MGLERIGASTAAVAPPPETAAAEPAPAPAPAASATAEVSLEIVTNPPGAEILVDGKGRGRSPVAIVLPRGKQPVSLEVRRRGFVTLRQMVSPDIDQRVVLDLRPGGGRPSAAPTARDPHGGHEVFE